ncbi:MAG: VCBS repeat-containing protein [Opitutales bacterium]|nr:VCBS repeat-containing protein [Opitutales bacterium]MBT5169682.1 VCBS repeat-containing protein [Opitutales bacterium]
MELKFSTSLFTFALLTLLQTACTRPETTLDSPAPPIAQAEIDLDRYVVSPIGNDFDDVPWVAHVRALDLNEDGLMDVIGCEAKDDQVIWLKQNDKGHFEEILLASDMQAPVHAEVYDLDEDGDLDILVSCMNIVFPNNDKIGALIALENDGLENFRKRIILEGVERVNDARAHDMDGDGDLDLVVGQFGYDQGEVRWMKKIGPWKYASQSLIHLSGLINVCVSDFNNDGHPDIAAQFSQQWEEIHLFENDGKGNFTDKIIWGSTNHDYASSGMTEADLNQDGLPDLVFTNGDGFGPTLKPGPRPWHGIQWLENMGDGSFKYSRIGDLAGAYSPVVKDVDQDGDQDILSVSGFNDWENPKADSLVWFRNDEDRGFTKVTLAHEPIQLLSIDFADFDGDGTGEIISGCFPSYPPYDRLSRFTIWKETANR